jgi:hypothetical protein
MFSFIAHIKVNSKPETTIYIKFQGQVRKVLFLITILFICSMIVLGQSTNNLNCKTRQKILFDFCGFYTPVLSKDVYGFNCDIKFYAFKRVTSGLSGSFFAFKDIDETFQYNLGKPYIEYLELGWINQYDFKQSGKIRMDINLNNGIAISSLYDRDQIVRSNYGGKLHDMAKKIATNCFYLLEPGFDISAHLFSIKNVKHNSDLYLINLITKAKYRFVFGNSKYGQLSDFSNYYFAVGLSLIYSYDPKEYHKPYLRY